jgi:hypothetical protein
MTETIAQCFLPIILYYSFRIYKERFNLQVFLLLAFARFALLTTHILTFVWSCLFVNLFFGLLILLDCIQVPTTSRVNLQKLISLGFAFLLSLILAMWYFAPIFFVKKYFPIFQTLGESTIYSNWLTPISSLLSMAAVSPMPLPGNGSLTLHLYPAVGGIALLAFGCVFYKLFTKSEFNRQEKNFAIVLLFLFLIAFLLVWSPYNFYRFLPNALGVQWTYRFLIQIIWISCLLFALATLKFFGNSSNNRYLILGLLLIGIAGSSWLYTEPGKTNVAQYPTKPYVGAKKIYEPGQDYIILPDSTFANTAEQILSSGLWSFSKIQDSCHLQGYKIVCNINNFTHKAIMVQLPMMYYPKLLDVRRNNKKIHYHPTFYSSNKEVLAAAVSLPPGSNTISVYFRGLSWANWVSAVTLTISIILFLSTIIIQIGVKFRNQNLKLNQFFISKYPNG